MENLLQIGLSNAAAAALLAILAAVIVRVCAIRTWLTRFG